MVTSSAQDVPSWLTGASSSSSKMFKEGGSGDESSTQTNVSDFKLGFPERAFSAASAAFISAIVVNPLDVAKTRLQAQAAGVPYQGLCRMTCFGTNTNEKNCVFTGWSRPPSVVGETYQMIPDMRCFPSRERLVNGASPLCGPECSKYEGTLDVFYKVIRQEGFSRLWRGTYASLALAMPTVGIYLPCYDIFRNFMEDFTSDNVPSMTPYVPLVAGSIARSLACVTCYPVELARTRMQAFKETQAGVKPPGVWKTLTRVVTPVTNTNNLKSSLPNYRFLWTGLGAQLARDVPFSAICWSTLEPARRQILGLVGGETSAANILGANFTAGFIAGTLAGAATCPLDVAKTRRQIEKDQVRALKMTTKQTLVEIWRDGGLRGLFTGVGPRVGRAGPSVGIVVSFYEVVKYALYKRRHPIVDVEALPPDPSG